MAIKPIKSIEATINPLETIKFQESSPRYSGNLVTVQK